MNNEQNILLPAQVIVDWEERLQKAGCTEREQAALKNLIRFTLPHPSRSCIDACVAGYAAACHDKPAVGPSAHTVSCVVEKLEQAGQLKTSNQHAQSHPLASGLKKIIAAASALQVAPDPWLSVFIGQCQQALTHPDALTPSSYYRHVVYLRDVMRFLMQSQVAGSLPADEPIGDMCSQLNALFLTAAETGEAMPIPIFAVSNLDVKIDDVCRLLSGQRMFGVPSVLRGPQDATDSTESKTSGRKPPLPPYLTLQSQDLKNSRPRPTVPKKQSLAYSLGEGADHCEQRPKTTLSSSKTNAEAHADSDVMEQAWVNAPPEFTPAERRKKYVSLLNVQAAQNTVSRSDMQQFSRRQLSTWLESIAHEDPTMGIFVLLIWTLGMTPERLQTVCLSTQPPMGAQVLLNAHTHWLSYRVLNLGATSDEDTLDDNGPVPANHLMQMALPASLVERIVATGDEPPFLALETRYPTLRKRVEKRIGTRPCSLKQWAASTPAFDADRFNLLEAAVKSGQIAFNEIASSAYRAQQNATLNATFAERLTALREYWNTEGLMTGPGTGPFKNLAITAASPDGLIGSQRYAPPEALAPFVRALRNAIKQRHQRLNGTTKTHDLRELLDLINLQALNYYLIIQLHSVGRPLNQKTQIGVGPDGLWCSDKASHRYRERKLIGAIRPADVEKERGLLLQQRQQVRATHQQLACVARALNIAVFRAEPEVVDLPCVTVYHHPRRCIEIHRMTPAKWQSCMDDLGLSHMWTTATNVFRHIASSELSRSMSDAVVDEVLGHKHPGRDWWGSESSGSMPELGVMASVIEAWADKMDVRVVKLDPRVFEGVYRAS